MEGVSRRTALTPFNACRPVLVSTSLARVAWERDCAYHAGPFFCFSLSGYVLIGGGVFSLVAQNGGGGRGKTDGLAGMCKAADIVSRVIVVEGPQPSGILP